MTELKGGCSCGEVEYRLRREPMFVNCCHCTYCQRETGGPCAVNAVIEAAEIEVLQGTPEPTPTPSLSGRPHDIYRCGTCRVALWSDYGRRPQLRFVRVSTLERPHALAPQAHIFTASKVPWMTFGPDEHVFEAYYDMAREWPAESLARRSALGLK